MCHFAAERRKLMEIIARLSPRIGAQRRIKIARAVELHLREQKGVGALHWERIGPGGGAMQNQRTHARELLENRGVPRLVVCMKGVRVGARAAISDEIRYHVVLVRFSNSSGSATGKFHATRHAVASSAIGGSLSTAFT
jgi:hypothetical protein